MKIAIPTRGTTVDDHFGHCEFYTLFTVNEAKEIVDEETLPSPQGCGCKSNIASVLKEKGVTVMLAGSMGDGALNVLSNQGIQVLRGCKGDVRKLAEAYLKGFVLDSGMGCHHEEGEGHHCSHHD
ncbi:MAG: NifB/NifX family molybdenum-iron cluster-binding protein [Marinifilaceae bacterium]|nr:NifB/NifX family molybdenum-iron cluster-binding protein [Marinifilaceae bacterium]